MTLAQSLEPGQVAIVRQRRFVITDVVQSALPTLSSASFLTPRQHLVSLSSIEDDALGETLQVIWEVEPGAQVREKFDLPTVSGFDPPNRFDTFLDAVRWGAVSQADTRVLLAPSRSGVKLEDYQLDPLVRAVQMPRVSLLIADDVGLGKTVEAGLVIQEMIVRNRARTVLIVCPSSLQLHWRDQMQEKFGLEFRIVDTALMKWLRRNQGSHANPWNHFPRLITSIDFIKRDRPLRLLRDLLPRADEARYPRKFDLLLIDEAHNIAPSGTQNSGDSQRTQAIRTIAPHFEHKLFLSATPHNGYQESFTALLELLDDQRFARGVMPDRRQLAAIMVRRMKDEIRDWDETPRFPKRQVLEIEVNYSAEEREVHRMLRQYARLRLRNSETAEERFATEFVLKLLKKRLFSSPAAFATTLRKHEESLQSVHQHKSIVGQAMIGVLQRQINQIDEEHTDDDEFEDATEGVLEHATRLFRPPSDEEQRLLDTMRLWATVAKGQKDQKTRALVQWLHGIVKPNGQWSQERVLLFTEYRTTQRWLQQILAAEGLATQERLMLLYGGMETEERERIKAAFQAHPNQSPVRILLATDAASEGIDLQNYCHRLIHVEIPWNPQRIEQRNGRIDRHGQQHHPLIYHFVAAGYKRDALRAWDVDASELEADLEFLMRAALKVEQIREDLGKVGPVIAQQVEEAMLGKRHQLDTRHAEADAGKVRSVIRIEQQLRTQVAQHVQQLRETEHALHLTPDKIQAVCKVALELAQQQPLQPIVAMPNGNELAGTYRLPTLIGSWQQASVGIRHPYTQEVRPIVFDPQLARQYGDRVVLAHLNHRLVQMATRLLRSEVWSNTTNQGLRRVTARLLPDHLIDTPVVIAYARLVVIGGDNQRLHEEIIASGGRLKPHFSRMNVGEVNKVLEEQLTEFVTPTTQARLLEVWNRYAIAPSLIQSLEVRQKEYANRLEALLQQRAEKEANDIASILQELAVAIDKELNAPEMLQLDLPGILPGERNVHIDALRNRRSQIPEEIKREQASVRRRFANPQTRLFPVAISFLVPKRLNG